MLHFLLLAVTLNFDSSGFNFENTYTENGLNITPNCHISFNNDGAGFGGSNYIATDLGGCYGAGTWNRDFPGPGHYQVDASDTWESTPAVLWIEAGGLPFSLLDFYIPLYPNFILTSSRGGRFVTSSIGFVSFSGDEWSDLDWLLFDIGSGIGISAGVGIDRLRVNIHGAARRVPEPGSILLLVLGVMMLRRKHA